MHMVLVLFNFQGMFRSDNIEILGSIFSNHLLDHAGFSCNLCIYAEDGVIDSSDMYIVLSLCRNRNLTHCTIIYFIGHLASDNSSFERQTPSRPRVSSETMNLVLGLRPQQTTSCKILGRNSFARKRHPVYRLSPPTVYISQSSTISIP